MKKIKKYRFCFPVFFTLISLPFFLSSCDNYNFSEPQPVDKANIYEFPDEFLGKWNARDLDEHSFENSVRPGSYSFFSDHNTGPNLTGQDAGITGRTIANQKSEEDSSCYLVNKKNVWLLIYSQDKVAAGAWPRVGKNGEFVYPAGEGFWHYQKEIKYDSLKRPTDTVNNYILHGEFIYEVYDAGFLNKGYKYHYDHDTIIVEKNDSIAIDLGQNAFLRKLDEKAYVLNIRNRILGEENTWWRIIILEKNEKDAFIMRECSSKTGTLPCMFYAKPSKNDFFYFDCRWNSAEMQKLISQGYFDNTEEYHKVKW